MKLHVMKCIIAFLSHTPPTQNAFRWPGWSSVNVWQCADVWCKVALMTLCGYNGSMASEQLHVSVVKLVVDKIMTSER
jgi:hypothetical protein